MLKLDLTGVPEKYIKINSYPELGLQIVKYSKRAFYDQAWTKYPILKECRGLIVDMEFNVVAKPFVKVLNLGEEGTQLPDFPFSMVDKINGFMAMVSYHNGKLVASTTGSLDSDFVTLIHNNLEKYGGIPGCTSLCRDHNLDLMFEIVDEYDPHIIKEVPGMYLIGARSKDTGYYYSEVMLDILYRTKFLHRSEVKRPKWIVVNSREEFDSTMASCEHEGYMVRPEKDYADYSKTVKVKSKFYLNRKFLARCGLGKTTELWSATIEDLFKMGLEEEFAYIVNVLRQKYTEEVWVSYSDQERLELIELAQEGILI